MARTILITVLVLLLANLGVAAAADDTYVVTLEARGTDVAKGLVYGPNTAVATGGVVARAGESGHAFLAFRTLASGDVCNAASGSARSKEAAIDEFLLPGTEMFTASIRPLQAEIGKVRFEVAWDRYRREASLAVARVGGDVRIVEMPEGEFHVLDFVAGRPTEGSYCYANVVVGVRGRIQEDDSLAATRFRYDVWWKHTDDAGRAETRRFVGTGRQGEVVAFALGERRQPVPELKDGRRWESILELSGEVQARARSDGRIDVRFGAGRWIDTELENTPRRGGIGDGGRKVVTVDPGETIALRLPPPGGRNEFVDSKTFYAGHTDELILTVTREK